jgi:hypothetical protein
MRSNQSADNKVADDDVFALTAGGQKQLKDSETSLSRLELELLVLVNGTCWPGAAVARTSRKPTLEKSGILSVAGYGLNWEFTLSANSGHSRSCPKAGTRGAPPPIR